MAVGQENLWNEQSAFARGVRAIFYSPHFGTLLAFAGFEVAYYFAFKYGISFGPASSSPFWFPDAVLLCALLKSRRDLWWLFILGTLPVRLFSDVTADVPFWFKIAFFANDTVTIGMAALILRRVMRNPLRFDTVRDFAYFVLFAAVLTPLISGLFGAATLYARGADFWPMFTQWVRGEALAQLIVTPAILYWVFETPWRTKPFDIARFAEAVALIIGLVLACYWGSIGQGSVTFAEARFYAPIPFLLWAALRFGMPGISGAVALMAAVDITTLLKGSGPFSGFSPAEAAFALQNFLFLRSVPFQVVAASVEQRKGVERFLHESEGRFRSMADSAPVLIWMSGSDKLGVFFNQGWLKFTGRTLEQELGDGWIDGVHPDDRQHCLDVCHATFDTRQPFEVEYRLRRHDGEYRWVLDVGTPRFAPNGEFLGYTGCALDITERRRVEESSHALAHVQRLASIGQLTAAMAHELKQPMSAIMSSADAAQMLLKSSNPPLAEIDQIVSDIREADLRAKEVLGFVQGFLRKQEIRMQPLDLNAAVSDVLPLVAGDARRRRVQIRTELTPDLSTALGNRTQLQQVLVNLIVNGMEAMTDTPAEQRRITIRTADGAGFVAVAVADAGPGISIDSLPRIFDSFYTTKTEGMGLGLAIARSIVDGHRGRIWVLNNKGGGATFYFTVPVAQGESVRANS